MTIADYLVEYLIELGVTDIFGMPGGVILEFLYSIDKKAPIINAHLTYHEQGAGFAACGYAQTTNKLGVAYSTRGPGFTNMITAVAEAYYDSIPVLFITAHNSVKQDNHMRIMDNQEMDVSKLVESISKYVTRIDLIEDAMSEIKKACKIALTGRRGPVVLDFNSGVLNSKIIDVLDNIDIEDSEPSITIDKNYLNIIKSLLSQAKRPVILFGDGVRQDIAKKELLRFAEREQIPALSSRFSQDIIPSSPLYFGYIGSHGLRYSNFILSKSDLIIAIGNRMAYPVDSGSYKTLMNEVNSVRIDIDASEFERIVPNCINIEANATDLLLALNQNEYSYQSSGEWVTTCNMLKNTLFNYDINDITNIIFRILECANDDTIIISDVGNNEFWLSRAYALSKSNNRVLFSKSFGALGCSIPKAIGASIADKNTVICFVGDQGAQINIQELMVIATNNLPIIIVVLNNNASGMIRDREKSRYGKLIHTTKESGYHALNMGKVANVYGIKYYQWKNFNGNLPKGPCIIEVEFDDGELVPFLPKFNPIQQMSPYLDEALYQKMDRS